MAPPSSSAAKSSRRVAVPAIAVPGSPTTSCRSPANGRRASPAAKSRSTPPAAASTGGGGGGGAALREPPTISPGSYSHAVQQMNRRQRKSTAQRLSPARSGAPTTPPRVKLAAEEAEPKLTGGMAYNLAQIERRQREAAVARGEDVQEGGGGASSADGVCTPPSPPSRSRSHWLTDSELGAQLRKGGDTPPARKLWMQGSASVALNSRQSFEMRLSEKKKNEQRRAELHALNRILARRDAQQFSTCVVVVGGSNVYGQAQTVWQFHPQVGVWRKLCQLLHPRCNAASCSTTRGDLVTCGGYITGGTFVDTVEMYEPKIKASRMLPPMPHGVYGGRAVCFGDRMLVVGGQSCEEVRALSRRSACSQRTVCRKFATD